MTMQTDVKAKKLTATGAMGTSGRARVKAIYYVAGATAGTIALNDGSASGVLQISIDTPASATATQMVLLPGEGVLFQNDPYLTLTNATSVTIFYA